MPLVHLVTTSQIGTNIMQINGFECVHTTTSRFAD